VAQYPLTRESLVANLCDNAFHSIGYYENVALKRLLLLLQIVLFTLMIDFESKLGSSWEELMEHLHHHIERERVSRMNEESSVYITKWNQQQQLLITGVSCISSMKCSSSRSFS